MPCGLCVQAVFHARENERAGDPPARVAFLGEQEGAGCPWRGSFFLPALRLFSDGGQGVEEAGLIGAWLPFWFFIVKTV
jgi:hypothetical protein